MARAWKAVEEAGLPEHLHDAGFKAALALQAGHVERPASSPLAGGALTPTLAQADQTVKADTPAKPLNAAEVDPFEKFAYETGIAREDLEEVFYFQDGQPGLNGPTRKWGKSKADQTRRVALAITAAYYFVVEDTNDTVKAVREACEALRCYDADNFARHLASTKGINYTGPRNQKVLRTKNDTIPELRAVISTYRGVED
ncbi:hypothetical protein NG819_05455 [Pseudarthrobacter sp. Fe7]|nr:hypothetical protein NG819_05455 [Pseudarthrobacter sp. Fe7]